MFVTETERVPVWQVMQLITSQQGNEKIHSTEKCVPFFLLGSEVMSECSSVIHCVFYPKLPLKLLLANPGDKAKVFVKWCCRGWSSVRALSLSSSHFCLCKMKPLQKAFQLSCSLLLPSLPHLCAGWVSGGHWPSQWCWNVQSLLIFNESLNPYTNSTEQTANIH